MRMFRQAESPLPGLESPLDSLDWDCRLRALFGALPLRRPRGLFHGLSVRRSPGLRRGRRPPPVRVARRLQAPPAGLPVGGQGAHLRVRREAHRTRLVQLQPALLPRGAGLRDLRGGPGADLPGRRRLQGLGRRRRHVRLGGLRRALPLHRRPRGRPGVGLGPRRPRVGEEAGGRRRVPRPGPRAHRLQGRLTPSGEKRMATRDTMDAEMGGDVVFAHTSQLDKIINLARANSLHYLLFGLACCGIELMQFGGPRADVDRFGAVFRATPRQADFMIVAGTLTYKMAERLKLLYDQMAEPKYVISMGSCANCGGLFQLAYSVCKGVDKVVPVDVYVPGCPPRPEALTEGLLRLQDLVMRERWKDKRRPPAALRQGGKA